MKKCIKLVIIASMLVSPMAIAESTYGGLSYGRVNLDDIYTGNIGIVLGGIADNGLGFEFFYSFTVVDYEFSSGSTFGGNSYDSAETDTVGLFAVYQTPGDVYFKAKLGYSYVNLTLDGEEDGKDSDTTDGFSYGIAGGMAIGDGAIEATYFWFPEFEKFDGVSIDEDVEMLNFTYLWTF